MIWLFLIIFSCFYISAVDCFFYQALPLVVHKTNNTYTAYCPWNDTRDPNLRCKTYKNVMGYCHKDHTPSSPNHFLNPLVQTLFEGDNCQRLMDNNAESSSEDGTCKSYSLCFNIGSDRSICTCDAGFFGDAYVGCKKHCYSNGDCVSPVSHCRTGTGNALSYCVCNTDYKGDGVMCYRNPCGADRYEKCGPDRNKVCVPTGPGDNDYRCMCPDGQFMDYSNTCVPEVTLAKNTVVTVTGKNVENGSRIDAGDCLSFVINDTSKSIFYHKNSGDSIYVRGQIKNTDVFTVFFVLTEDITAFSALYGTPFGLTKLYSISHTLKNCKIGHVKVTRPNGHQILVGEDSKEKIEVHVRNLNAEELEGGLATALILPEKVLDGEFSDAEVRPISTLELQGVTTGEL